MIPGFRDAIRTQANNKDGYSISHVIYWQGGVGGGGEDMLPVDHQIVLPPCLSI